MKAKAMKSKVISTKSLAKLGGNGKMAGQSGVANSEPGKVSVGGRKGNNTFSVKGGNGKMAGFTGSTAAKAK